MLLSPLRSSLLAIFLAVGVTIASAAAEPRFTLETPPGWTETRGGAGGKVLRVTTLAASGPGSLAQALAAEGPRVIEFTVAGIIDLREKSLRVTQPFVTIAGETAPSPASPSPTAAWVSAHTMSSFATSGSGRAPAIAPRKAAGRSMVAPPVGARTT